MSFDDKDTLALMTPEEREALQDFDEEEVAAIDNDTADPAAADKALKADDKEPEAKPDEKPEPEPDKPAPEAADDKATQLTPEPEDRFRPSYTANVPEDLAEQGKAIEDKRADLVKQYKDGEIDFDTYDAQSRELNRHETQLVSARQRAEILADINRQNAVQEFQWSVKQAFKSFKAEGIDYADKGLQKDFDMFMRALGSDPENADKDTDFFIQESHRRVLALRGLAPTKKADVSKETREQRQPPVKDIPQTLAQVPGATESVDAADEFAGLDKLDGDAYQAAFNKLSASQKQRYLER